MAKRKNPQDATLRNIRALKKRVRRLELGLKFCLRKVDWLPAGATYAWAGPKKAGKKR